MRTLVLWDIDGTLVLTGRAGLRALERAVGEVTGVRGAVDGVPVAGRTERAIVHDVLGAAGQAVTEAAVRAVRDRYCDLLAEEVARDTPHWKGILPGVPAALDALAPLEADGTVAVGLLTGNFARGAAIKLGYFDLWTRLAGRVAGDYRLRRAAISRRDPANRRRASVLRRTWPGSWAASSTSARARRGRGAMRAR